MSVHDVVIAAWVVKLAPAMYALLPVEQFVLTRQLYVVDELNPLKAREVLAVETDVHEVEVDFLYCKV